MMTASPRVAVICEYNPFHQGHARLFELARTLYPSCEIISVMSGNTVQRGDLAVYDRYTRAEAAINCGSSLVLELPYPYSCATSEQFARAGVYIAAEAGAEYLIFGTCAENPNELFYAAKIIGSDAFQNELTELAKREPKNSYISLREQLYKNKTGQSLPTDGNSSLGIEYIIAAAKINKSRISEGRKAITCVPIKRQGKVTATACREALRHGIPSTSEKLAFDIPEAANDVFKARKISGGLNAVSSIILHSLRTQRFLADTTEFPFEFKNNSETHDNFAKSSIGSVSRQSISSLQPLTDIRAALTKSALKARDLSELEIEFPTASYTRARIRRELLDAVILPDIPNLSARNAIRNRPPCYTVLLGADEKGRAILSEMKKSSPLPVITKPSDTNKLSPEGKWYYSLSERAEALYALSFDPPLSPAELIPNIKFKP